MEDIIKTITDLLGGIPVIGDIIKLIMGLIGGGEDEADDSTDAQ